MPRKTSKRDIRRLDKAEKAAQLEKNIENELKERLKKGVYVEIYNIDFKKFEDILEMEKDENIPVEKLEEAEVEYVEGDDMEEMDDMEDMEDYEGFSEGGSDEDVLDDPVVNKSKGSGSDLKRNVGKRSRKVVAEVERDEETGTRQRMRM